MEGPKPDKPSKAKRPPKDFDGDYKGSMHTDVDHGWVGIPAAALRSAMIRACSTCGVEMTKAKQCFFVLADGIDRREKPLVKITKGKPERFDSVVKNSNGSTDVRARARFATGWECNLRIQYDADMFSAQGLPTSKRELAPGAHSHRRAQGAGGARSQSRISRQRKQPRRRFCARKCWAGAATRGDERRGAARMSKAGRVR